MKATHANGRHIAAAVAVVVIWSTSFSFAKEAIEHLGPWVFRCYCMAVGLLPLLPFMRGSFADIQRLDAGARRTLLCAVTLTGTVVASLNMLALAYFPASSVLAMMYTMPAFASVIEACRARKWSWLTFAAPAAALSGVLVYGSRTALGPGALLILCNALLWALATSLSGRVGSTLRPLTAVSMQMLIAFLASLPMLFVAVAWFDQPLPTPNRTDVVGVLYAGLLNGALVFWLWYYAIQGLGSVRVAWYTLLVPVLGGVFAAVFFAEHFGRFELLGIALISLSMLVQRAVSGRMTQAHR